MRPASSPGRRHEHAHRAPIPRETARAIATLVYAHDEARVACEGADVDMEEIDYLARHCAAYAPVLGLVPALRLLSSLHASS